MQVYQENRKKTEELKQGIYELIFVFETEIIDGLIGVS